MVESSPCLLEIKYAKKCGKKYWLSVIEESKKKRSVKVSMSKRINRASRVAHKKVLPMISM
jgi:hypothetical protein